MNRKYRAYLIIAGIVSILVPFVLRGFYLYFYKEVPSDNIAFLALDQVFTGIFAGLVASLILDYALKESIVKFEDRIVHLLLAFNTLGIDAIAKRGDASSVSRNMVPEVMIKSAKAEIMILAASGKGTLVGQKDLLKTQLAANPLLKLGCILINPKSEFAVQYKLENGKPLVTEINDAINSLRELRGMFGDRVKLKLLMSPPTFLSTAIDVEILSDSSGYGLMGIQPRLEGDVHHGLIIDIKKKDDGLWLTFKKALEHYWASAVFYDLGKR
jgi:hypothetical protein